MFINNLPIRLKLTLISLLPMLLALSFIGHDIKTNLQTYTAMSQGQALGSLALQASELVHQLQRERGLSSGYLSSKGQRFSSQLPRQQQQTDQLHSQFKESLRSFDAKAYSPGLSQLLNRVSQQLSELGQIRSQIRQLSIDPGTAIKYYSNMNVQLLSITHQASNVNQMNLQNAAATEQQSATVNEINVNIQDVQRSYNETNHKVGDLNQSAQRLEELSLMLTNEVKQFKT